MKITIKVFYFIILGSFLFSCGEEGPITLFDYPNKIETKIDTIEVSYTMWACACPNWIETNYQTQNSYISTNRLEDSCFFIEASKETKKLPEKYHTTYLNGKSFSIKLVGSFYKDKGISRDYIKPTSQKPEHAKVFRYTKFEILEFE